MSEVVDRYLLIINGNIYKLIYMYIYNIIIIIIIINIIIIYYIIFIKYFISGIPFRDAGYILIFQYNIYISIYIII